VSTGAVDPDGIEWSVRRRWYPWRRALSLRDLWSSASGSGTTDAVAETADADEEPNLPKNVALKAFLVAIAAVLWVVYGVGKLLFYTGVALLFFVGSVVELAVALVVMPITLSLRVFGANGWPVDVVRQGEHVLTRRAKDFAEAGDVRDGLIADIGRGVLPVQDAAQSA